MIPSTRRSILLLFCLALFFQGLDTFYYDLFPSRPYFSEAEIEEVKAQWALEAQQKRKQITDRIRDYDPNDVDTTFLRSLGLEESLINSWLNYLKAGGRFRQKSDLLHLYAMDSGTYELIAPYAEIKRPESSPLHEQEESLANESLNLKSFNPNEVRPERLQEMGLPQTAIRGIIGFREKFRPFRHKTDIYKVYGIDSSLGHQLQAYIHLAALDKDSLIIGPIDLNLADSSDLVSIPGIGPGRAQRIIDWRQRLGGFHTKEQLIEHYIVDSIILNRISGRLRISADLRKINLNTSSLEELRAHPYINYYLAQNIINFREQVRAFKSVDELMNIELVDAVLFSKLAPYLKVSEKDMNALNLSN